MSRPTASLPSRLGFGVSGVHGTPLIGRADTAALIVRAAELGVRMFDTAPSYGGGEAERRLGAALKTMDRSQVWISTKAGVTGSALTGRRRDFSPDAIEASVRASLSRLGVEGLDGLFLHGAARGELTRPLFRRLRELRQAGAFRRLGAAGRGADLDAAMASGRFRLVMTPVHPWIGAAARARIAEARAAGLRVIAIETAGPGAPPIRPPRRASDLHGMKRTQAAAFPPGRPWPPRWRTAT
jgi:aryl-alcohol dehydrogenase-like predicted oxidoreductase